MLSYQKGVVKTSVRHLVEFLFRGGDITTGSSVSASPEAMLEGSCTERYNGGRKRLIRAKFL